MILHVYWPVYFARSDNFLNEQPKEIDSLKNTFKKLTCLAIPKSASLISPLGSTSMLAPLISLRQKKKKKKKTQYFKKE